MSRQSAKAARRDRKRRVLRTQDETRAFEYGMKTHKEAVVPTVKRRAATIGGALGFAVGVSCSAAAYYLLG